MPRLSFLAIAIGCGLAGIPAIVRAETTDVPGFNPVDFTTKTTLGEQALLDQGKLHTLGSLLGALKVRTGPESFKLPPPSTVKLGPADVHDRMLASTLVVGLYYHCKDCHQMHFFTGAGFVVADGSVVTTCAHMLALDASRMLLAYPVAIDAQGEVDPIDRVVAFDQDADTVLLHVEGLRVPPLPLRANACVGEPVYRLSHPCRRSDSFRERRCARL